jgi:hypothetical protein
MKRSLLLAISVLALTAVSQPLFAAEAETPAPRERAAPARERQAAPARQRAAPQQAAQSGQSSWTGSQAGGFGGGNAGGGSFADPPCQSTAGLNSLGCVPTGLRFSLAHTGGTGGAVYQYLFPFGNYFVAGVLLDIAASNSTASSSFSTVHPDAGPGSMTAENFYGSVRQGTNGSVRLKFGVPLNTVFGNTLVYFTAGTVVSKIDTNYTYSASSVVTGGVGVGCAFFNPACATSSFANYSSSRTQTGFAGGGGVDIKLPGFGPGVVLRLDYTVNAFGSYSQTANIATTTVLGAGCIPSGSRVCAVTDSLKISGQTYQKPTVGVSVAF